MPVKQIIQVPRIINIATAIPAAPVRTVNNTVTNTVTNNGPPGFAGDDGDDGFPGPPGSAGAAGSPGTPGSAGAAGAVGSPGRDGEDGDDSWVPGPQGPQGREGPGAQRGFDGEDGDDSWVPGPVGPQGAQGPGAQRGSDGEDGDDSWVPGPMGPQGKQGVQGAQGWPGDDGDDGFTGPQGVAGSPGVTGSQGPYGGAMTLDYIVDTTSIANSDPGSGKFRFNNATQGSASNIFINYTDNNGQDETTLLQTLNSSLVGAQTVSNVRIVKKSDLTKWIYFKIGINVSNVGYQTINCTQIAQSGVNPFVNGDECLLAFGTVGPQGPQGFQGAPGFDGEDGDPPWMPAPPPVWPSAYGFAYTGTNPAVVAGTFITCPYDTVLFSKNITFGSNKFTIQIPGIYEVMASVAFTFSGTDTLVTGNYAIVRVFQNVTGYSEALFPVSDVKVVVPVAAIHMKCAVGDTISVQILCEGSFHINDGTTPPPYFTYLSVALISPI